jgi:hypothetical protein
MSIKMIGGDGVSTARHVTAAPQEMGRFSLWRHQSIRVSVGPSETSPEEPTAQTLSGASATTPLNAENLPTFGLGTVCQIVPLKWTTKVLAGRMQPTGAD